MFKKDIKIISGSSHPALATAIARQLGVSLVDAEMEYFANTEMRPVIRESIRNKDVYIIQTGSSSQEPCRSVNDYLMEVFLLTKTCHRSDARSINLVAPCYPYARQDKKDNPRGSISAKDVADILEAAGIKRMISVDLHAGQIQGFFNIPCDNLYALFLIKKYFDKNIFSKDKDYKKKYVLISPDEGSLKRTREYAAVFGLPFLVLSKDRNYSKKNVVEQAILIGDNEKYLRGRTAIIVDDMVDTFGTINTASEVLMAEGAKDIIVAVTHGILSDPALERIEQNDNIKLVLVSDSIPQEENVKRSQKIKMYSIAPLLAESIKRLETGRSLSALFKRD